MLRLTTFGGLSLEGECGPLGGAAAQRRRLAVLAVLAAARERGVTRDKLVGLLWPEVDDARARSALSQALYTLKRDSGTAGLVAGHERLVLDPRLVSCDLVDFEDAVARADLLLAARLYRGPFLDGVHLDEAPEFEHWLDGIRLDTAQAAERAIERLALDAEERADPAAAVEWWGRLATMDPLKTRAVVGLMRAMVGRGDRAGAIREAERYARRMREELGEEPRDAVTALADELRAEVRAQGAPAPLPLVGDEMIGREVELRAACALLVRPAVALLTLTGPGGTGKTRLAIQMARQLESVFDRVCFVDLSTVRESSAVIPAIASVLGVQPHGGRDILESLAAACAGRRILLVLDNFEQVVSAAPALTRLAASAPGVRLLVTSRMRLGVRAEHEFFVAPLVVPDEHADTATLRESAAVRLFVRRASRANPALAWDDDSLRAAARLCSRLDGLPLAIELAAARCRLMSPSALVARVENGFDLLSGGSRDMPERHRTIRHTVAWSVALLGPDEKRLWARLTIFPGGCTLSSAEAVCGGAAERLRVLDGVSALLDANLLIREMPAHGGEPRLRMLQTVRELAQEEFARDPEASAVRRRHRDWYRQLAQSLAPTLTGEAQREALATLASEHANLDAALEHAIESGDATAAVTLGASLWRYWLVRGFLTDGHAWLLRILAMPGARDPALETGRADVMTGAGHIAQNTGAVDEAAQHFRAVLEIRRRFGDRAGQARTLADLGWIAWRRCDFPDARRLSTECLTLAQELGATRVAALALTNLGAAALFEGNVAEARTAFARSAELRAAVADRRGVAFANSFLGWATCRAGDLARASELLEGAEATLRELGDERLVYFARDIRAEVCLRAGDADRAAAILELDAISGVRRFGDRWSVAHGLALASWASRVAGRTEQAVAFATESLELRRAEGDRYGEAESLALLAAAARATGGEVAAAELLQQSCTIRVAIGDTAELAECDTELAALVAHA